MKLINNLCYVILIVLAVVGVASLPIVAERVEADRRLEKMWADFLEVPKDYRDSTTARADALVRNWQTPPTAAQMEFLRREVAPRLNHIYRVNSGTEFARTRRDTMIARHMPAIERAAKTAR